jgi:hypothetical protein
MGDPAMVALALSIDTTATRQLGTGLGGWAADDDQIEVERHGYRRKSLGGWRYPGAGLPPTPTIRRHFPLAGSRYFRSLVGEANRLEGG